MERTASLELNVQVSIVAFKKGQLRVLSHAWDRNLGGRDFDEVLFNHFCAEFGAKHKIDIKSNARASFRLRQACEKVQPTSSQRHKFQEPSRRLRSTDSVLRGSVTHALLDPIILAGCNVPMVGQ